jgi:tetratricopeptide (TPR) repeat protein
MIHRARSVKPGVCAAILACSVAFIPSASADIIVLKETDKNGKAKQIIGRIVETTLSGDKEAVVIESEGKRRQILRSKIERIEPSLNEAELERLDPKNASDYFRLGIKYAQQSDEMNDPDARTCAIHLFSAALELDPKQHAVDAHLQLAQLCPSEESIGHLTRVLRLDPKNAAASEQLRELSLERSKQMTKEFDELRPLLKTALRDQGWAPLVSFAKSSEGAAVLMRLTAAFSGVQKELAGIAIPTDCPTCKGRTQVHCTECRNGRVPCASCGGRGTIATSQTSGFVDPVSGKVLTSTVPTRKKCLTCNGQRSFPCTFCREGWLTCTACAGRQTSVTVSPDLKQKLAEINRVLQQPPGASWAQVLLVQDRAIFRPLNVVEPTTSAGLPGQFYRRSGQWQATP